MQYAYRLNQAVIDGLAHGVPQGYVDKCMRPFLPSGTGSGDEEMVKRGIHEAVRLGVDIRKVVQQVEKELAMGGPVGAPESSREERVLKLVRGLAPEKERQSAQIESSRRRALTSGF